MKRNLMTIVSGVLITVVLLVMCSCSAENKDTDSRELSMRSSSSERDNIKIDAEASKDEKTKDGICDKNEENSDETLTNDGDFQGNDMNGADFGKKENSDTSKNDTGFLNDDLSLEIDEYKLCITENFKGFDGNYSYAFCDYKSEISICENNTKMKSASIIKLFIMEYAYDLLLKNIITPETIISGQTVLSLIESMIIYSDNNSTNILIDYFGMDNINVFIKHSGYTDTILARKMLDTSAAARGNENFTSVADVIKFLDKLYMNRHSFPQKDMLDIMKKQSISTKIRRDIPAGTVIANKTGELADVDNDAGIIFTPNGDFAFVCLTSGASPEPARSSIAKSARDLYDYIVNKE